MIAAIAAAGNLLIAHPLWIVIIVGSLSGVAADTWSTEWGRAYGGRPLCLRYWKRVPAGESGAISIAGLLASVAGAASIAISALVVNLAAPHNVWVYLVAGTAGSLIDSLAGAWLQARWPDGRGSTTEESADAISSTPLRGIRWIDNNVVNLFAAVTGAFVAALLID